MSCPTRLRALRHVCTGISSNKCNKTEDLRQMGYLDSEDTYLCKGRSVRCVGKVGLPIVRIGVRQQRCFCLL